MIDVKHPEYYQEGRDFFRYVIPNVRCKCGQTYTAVIDGGGIYEDHWYVTKVIGPGGMSVDGDAISYARIHPDNADVNNFRGRLQIGWQNTEWGPEPCCPQCLLEYQKNKERQAQRKQDGQCLKCGRRLGFLERVRGRVVCRNCH
jgi:hypothetical protein